MSSNVMQVAKTGLNAQQARIQTISNNLANVNTTGFKRDRANFESLLYQTWRPAGSQTSEATAQTSPTTLGTGVRLVSTEKMYTQGSLTTTDNALDMAIDGKGFFQVLMPDGRTGYTRNGTFSQNADGVLTTSSGYVVQPEIQIPAEAMSISISRDGVLSASWLPRIRKTRMPASFRRSNWPVTNAAAFMLLISPSNRSPLISKALASRVIQASVMRLSA